MHPSSPPTAFRTPLTSALLCCVALLACGGGSDAASSPTPPTDAGACSGFSQAELVATLNTARSQSRQCGATRFPAVAPLSWNGTLAVAAGGHSADMAKRNLFSHTGSDGRDVGQRVSDAGYGWTSVAENIAGGPSSVAAVMAGWLSSPGHCANIMGGSFADIGFACVAQDGTRYTHYWTLVLARR